VRVLAWVTAARRPGLPGGHETGIGKLATTRPGALHAAQRATRRRPAPALSSAGATTAAGNGSAIPKTQVLPMTCYPLTDYRHLPTAARVIIRSAAQQHQKCPVTNQ